MLRLGLTGGIASGKSAVAAMLRDMGFSVLDAADHLEYKKGESWDRVIHQGVHLLQKFVQDDRVRVHHPESNLQVKLAQKLPNDNEFVAYIDALGELDGHPYLIE